jgi:tetratricopeptide (TPR) repeat protein
MTTSETCYESPIISQSSCALKWGLRVICLLGTMAFMSAIAGSPGPPFSESATLAHIQKLKETKDEIMPGDTIPRRLRLADSLYALAHFYNDQKFFEKADACYAETFAILKNDKSAAGRSARRNYAESTARDYLERGDLAKAKPYIDVAWQMCREDSTQKEALPSVLTTLARWQRHSKLWKEAESSLLEALAIRGEYGQEQRGELALVYLESCQWAHADKTIREMEKSNYADSSCLFLRAHWLRATGKQRESEQLEAKARAKKAEELEKQKNSQ